MNKDDEEFVHMITDSVDQMALALYYILERRNAPGWKVRMLDMAWRISLERVGLEAQVQQVLES